MDSGKLPVISEHLGREIVGEREREGEEGEGGSLMRMRGVFSALEMIFG